VYLDELTPIGIRTVRIQYLVRGQAEAGEKMGELIMQIARRVA